VRSRYAAASFTPDITQSTIILFETKGRFGPSKHRSMDWVGEKKFCQRGSPMLIWIMMGIWLGHQSSQWKQLGFIEYSQIGFPKNSLSGSQSNTRELVLNNANFRWKNSDFGRSSQLRGFQSSVSPILHFWIGWKHSDWFHSAIWAGNGKRITYKI